MFSKTSRYHDLPDRTWRGPDGTEVVYRSRRLIPGRHEAAAGRAVVAQSERLDLVAARTLGRAELFWRLCDANLALDPFDVVGNRTLRVPEI